MARILPDGWRELPANASAQREIETLAQLSEALPADYTVYHGIHWSTVERRFASFGEIDFVVVNRAGDLLLIEQKSGFLSETPEGLIKQYPGRTKSVPAQMARSVNAMKGKLAERADIPTVQVDALLYCPDYKIRETRTAGLNPERIVDAGRRDQLALAIQSALPPSSEGSATAKIHRFIQDIVHLDTDVSALMGQARQVVTRLSGGLAQWGRQLDFEPFRLRVRGTAGSGKTQLALAEFRAAVEAGRRALYVCFNRPLADQFRAIAPPAGMVCSFHQLCRERLQHYGRTLPDFTRPDAFEALEQQAMELPADDPYLFDTLIVDEGQDFSSQWKDLLFALVRPGGRIFWMEDPMQNLYGRPPVELPSFVTLTARQNFRSPRAVVSMLQSLLPGEFPIEAASPFATNDIDFITYRDSNGLYQGVKDAIRQCYSEGYRKHDVALVSFHGYARSSLIRLDQLGPHSLRRYTGTFDLFGNPVYSEGELLTESVYRFKGQSAPAIIFAELDFESLDEQTIRKIFVGATRAMMKLVLVLHDRAATALMEKLDGNLTRRST